MKDLIAIVVILAVVGLSLTYIIKSKKKGVKCIGCPAAGQCRQSGRGKCS